MIILNLIDLATTMYIIALGGVELSPGAAWLIRAGLFPLVKTTLGTGCILWLEHQAKFHHSARVGKWVVTIYYTMLCINNLITIGVILT